jgi:hypothetical protein
VKNRREQEDFGVGSLAIRRDAEDDRAQLPAARRARNCPPPTARATARRSRNCPPLTARVRALRASVPYARRAEVRPY